MKPSEAPAASALAWSGDGRLIAHAGHRGLIVIAERVDDSSHRERTVVSTDLAVTALALSHKGEWLAAAGSGYLTLWWNGRLDEQVVEVSRGSLPKASGDGTLHLAFAPDDTCLAVANGVQITLVRLDLSVLRPKAVPSILSIRKVSEKRWDFVLVTPGGQLTERLDARPDLDAESVLDRLRRSLMISDDEAGTATPADRLDEALAPLRRRLLPSGMGDSKAMALTDNAVELDIDSALADYPWELLLTGRGAAPLGPTHGLVRMRRTTRWVQRSGPSEAPLHALLLSTGGIDPVRSSSTEDLDRAQAAELARALREAGSPQGLVEHRSGVSAGEIMKVVFGRPWRLLVLVGSPGREGQFMLNDKVDLGAFQLVKMQRVPDVVVLLGGDFRHLAEEMHSTGVAVCIASGWPILTESVAGFFEELFAVLRSGQPLIRAVQAARQRDRSAGQGTAWALQVIGDPLWTWPEVPTWRATSAD